MEKDCHKENTQCENIDAHISKTKRQKQLLQCCEEQFRKYLKRNAAGSLTNKSVDKVMTAMKKIPLREENYTMVARVQHAHPQHASRPGQDDM